MTVIGVAWNGTDESMSDFVARHALSFANVRDENGEIFARFEVSSQPAWVFVASDGTVTRARGVLSDERLDDIVSTLD